MREMRALEYTCEKLPFSVFQGLRGPMEAVLMGIDRFRWFHVVIL